MSWRPRKLSRQCVYGDEWDRMDLRKAAREVRALSHARTRLRAAAPSGAEAVDDTFFLLLKADPMLVPVELVAPSHRVNWAIIDALAGLSATRRLRLTTVGDRFQAASACRDLAATLEGLFDQLAALTERASELDELWSQVEELRGEVVEAQETLDSKLGDEPDDDTFAAARESANRLKGLQDRLEDLDEVLADGLAELDEKADVRAAVVRADLASAVEEVSGKFDEMTATMAAWGLEPGDLNRMSARERLELAQRLESPHLRAIADLFGRMENLALSAQAEFVEDAYDEVYDLELGAELSRLAPSEFLYLAEPGFESMFLSRLADRELLQYAVRGTDDAGRGGVVLCVDESGSMSGDRAVFAGALMLTLLHQARRQHRPMHVIHFSGYQRYRLFEFSSPEDFEPSRLLEAAEVFYGGGTDFETPMEVALHLLEDDFSATAATKGDVVFVTDDECSVSPTFMADYLAAMHRIGARTWGVLVAPMFRRDGALAQMSEGRVLTVEDLTSGTDVRRLLRSTL